MKLLKLLLAFNICLVAYFGTLHGIEHKFNLEHDNNCLECLALGNVDNGLVTDEPNIEAPFEFNFEKLVVKTDSILIKYIGNLPQSRGPPSSLV